MFRAFRITNEDGQTRGRVVEMSIDELDAGTVTFRNAYSGVNYKDALAATGSGGRVIRRFPVNGGIDAAGVVEASSDPRFKAGDPVICTSYDMGVAHDGGFAGYCRVPGDWVLPLPPGLSLYEAMALGTAGYTAGLAIELLELNGLHPDKGRVLVNGASGGVGALVIDMLDGLGYQVTALTGKPQAHDFLHGLGAKEVLARDVVTDGSRPLEKSLWAAAFDSVGGVQLAWLIRTMQQHGLIASIGNAGGVELNTTVLPFILRGVRLIGADSAYSPMPLRRRVWERLASDLKPRHFDAIVRTIEIDGLPDCFGRMLAGENTGRAVVRF